MLNDPSDRDDDQAGLWLAYAAAGIAALATLAQLATWIAGHV